MINKIEIIEFSKYSTLIFRKWALWIFLILDVIGAFIQFVAPSFTPPSIFYGLSAIVGFFVAGYQVYDEAAKDHHLKIKEIIDANHVEIESYRQKIAKLSTEVNIDSILKVPNIDISLLEGHEYVFDLMPDLSSIREPFLPEADIKINLRIENTGCSLDILIINIIWHREIYLPVSLLHLGTAFSTQNTKLDYPIPMAPGTLLECNMKARFGARSYHSKAQFAANIRDWRDGGYLSKATIQLETVDSAGNKNSFTLDADISFRPLINQYISYWQDHGQEDLIRLAGGITHKTISDPKKEG